MNVSCLCRTSLIDYLYSHRYIWILFVTVESRRQEETVTIQCCTISALFPQTQVEKETHGHWEPKREGVCQEHQLTYFRFCGEDRLQVLGQLVPVQFSNVYPAQEGWKYFGCRAQPLAFRAAVTTTNHIGKSPQGHFCVCVCRVCGKLLSNAPPLKLKVHSFIRSVKSFCTKYF